MADFPTKECNLLESTWEVLFIESHPIQISASVCLLMILCTFFASTLTGNYSQVDKLWSIIPFIYAWIFVCDARTLLMAIVATIWGVRLTWNFNRRGGFSWPPWSGDQDYRWKILQDGFPFPILKNKLVWTLFNLVFTSIYQNILLFLTVAPSIVAHIVATTPGCDTAPLNSYDIVGALLFLFFVVIESIADNQQYSFQTEKYRLRHAGSTLESDYADGFCQSGLFSIVRKPNYAAEQSIWICYYIFSIAAFQGKRWMNWSIIGCLLLSTLFQGSAWFTELITVSTYPRYKQYMQRVPLFLPKTFRPATSKAKVT
jgi:steroid 5-alpha reductase family enzyme